MFTKLIEVEKRHLNSANYEIRYFRNTKLNGETSFTSEVDIGLHDKIILDGRSMAHLKYKLDLVLPVALHSRRGVWRFRNPHRGLPHTFL
jgi:hypothetical protein